ncbi:MAG TPA: AMP-binding protein [Spongiibacteraceae bacterium]|nr:AMP-binding protein [Spongiibacteraceae bacterium]
MSLIPLLPDFDSNAVAAYHRGDAIARGVFLGHVLALAEALPHNGKILNMCADRYAFAVALFAAIAKGCITILPNSAAPEHLRAVSAEHNGLFVVGDAGTAAVTDLSFLDVDAHLGGRSLASALMPMIDCERPIALVYTSGSTGSPRPHRKTFGRVRRNILAGAERLWRVAGGPCAVIGTTPIRHMYGLESSVLLPIFGGGCLAAEIPFFPADVQRCLAQMPAPRLLVSTPFHLRKLIEADIELPAIAAVLSATAPLIPELALRVEQQLSCPVIEIYGSTETGQLATRFPCRGDVWETLAGVELRVDGDEAWAHGDVYETAQPINDVIELESPSHFRLVDRKANMINVAGKRNSLSCLNAAIAKLPGVIDAVFFVPRRDNEMEVERLAAFVVAPDLNRAQVLAGLRAQIDPVFLPRPLIFVEALPRDGNGKIQAAAMQNLIAQHLDGAD